MLLHVSILRSSSGSVHCSQLKLYVKKLYVNKDIINYSQNTTLYYNLLIQGYMFRLLRVVIRPSNEPTQYYLIPSALSCTGYQIVLGWFIRGPDDDCKQSKHVALNQQIIIKCCVLTVIYNTFIDISNTSGCLALDVIC